MAIRTMTIFIFILGVQMTAGTYFQAVGKPKYSILISLSRNLLFMVPFLIILPIFFGIKGIMYCYPASDVFAMTLSTALLVMEMRKLGKDDESAAADA
jgi:Na+-driven multidrug efflux pump